MTTADQGPRILSMFREFDEAVAAAATELGRGGIVIIPTDTVYGLAALASDGAAVEAVFAAKNRPADRRVAVLVADTAQAESLVRPSTEFELLAERFWPGPLTMVAPRSPEAPRAAGDRATIGVRCPNHRFVVEVCRTVGPLATTSANSHGEASATQAAEASLMLPEVPLLIDGGPCRGMASTVVDLCGHQPVVLREGSITEREITAVVDRRS